MDFVLKFTHYTGCPVSGYEPAKASREESRPVAILGREKFCSAERGLRAEEMIEGVESASMVDLVNWVVQSDKIIFL